MEIGDQGIDHMKRPAWVYKDIGVATERFELAIARRVLDSIVEELSRTWEELIGVTLAVDWLDVQLQNLQLAPPSELTITLTVQIRFDELTASRHAGGYRFKVPERVLRQFAGYCRREGYPDGSITREAVDGFLYGRHLRASTIRRNELALRQLAGHAQAAGWDAFTPAAATQVRVRHQPPYVFTDDEVRRKLRDVMLELNPPKGLGFIVRTAGIDRTKRELSRDLAYLLRLWKVIVRRIKKFPAPIDIYEESDMIIRTIRDIFTGESTRSTSTNPRPTSGPRSFCKSSCPATSVGCNSTKARSPCSTSTTSTAKSACSTSERFPYDKAVRS